jgi:hypothetical protein
LGILGWSLNQEPYFQERKNLKPGIRNQKILKLNPGTGIRNLGSKISKITKTRNKKKFLNFNILK